MKKDGLWTVGDEGIRPAGEPDRCFYCHEKKGSVHKLSCVVRERTVVVRATVEYVIAVPESWSKDKIEFHRNESTWCKSNGLEEVDAVRRYRRRNDICSCDLMKYEYVREAEVNDESRSGVFVKNCPN